MNYKLTPVDWLTEQFYNNEGIITTKQLQRAKEIETKYIEIAELDAKEIAIIKQCAEQSTSNASSYSDGYNKGYMTALQYIKFVVDDRIKTITI